MDYTFEKLNEPRFELPMSPEPTTSPVSHFSLPFLSMSLKPTQLLRNVVLLVS